MANSMAPWRPFGSFADVRHTIDRLLDEMGNGEGSMSLPAIDVVREENKITVKADVPGYKTDEVKIEVADDILTISGEHVETKEEKDKDYVRRERRYGSFSRSIALPRHVDASKIDATCCDGVLDLTVPLPSAEQAKPVQITPKAA